MVKAHAYRINLRFVGAETRQAILALGTSQRSRVRTRITFAISAACLLASFAIYWNSHQRLEQAFFLCDRTWFNWQAVALSSSLAMFAIMAVTAIQRTRFFASKHLRYFDGSLDARSRSRWFFTPGPDSESGAPYRSGLTPTIEQFERLAPGCSVPMSHQGARYQSILARLRTAAVHALLFVPVFGVTFVAVRHGALPALALHIEQSPAEPERLTRNGLAGVAFLRTELFGALGNDHWFRNRNIEVALDGLIVAYQQRLHERVPPKTYDLVRTMTGLRLRYPNVTFGVVLPTPLNSHYAADQSDIANALNTYFSELFDGEFITVLGGQRDYTLYSGYADTPNQLCLGAENGTEISRYSCATMPWSWPSTLTNQAHAILSDYGCGGTMPVEEFASQVLTGRREVPGSSNRSICVHRGPNLQQVLPTPNQFAVGALMDVLGQLGRAADAVAEQPTGRERTRQDSNL